MVSKKPCSLKPEPHRLIKGCLVRSCPNLQLKKGSLAIAKGAAKSHFFCYPKSLKCSTISQILPNYRAFVVPHRLVRHAQRQNAWREMLGVRSLVTLFRRDLVSSLDASGWYALLNLLGSARLFCSTGLHLINCVRPYDTPPPRSSQTPPIFPASPFSRLHLR